MPEHKTQVDESIVNLTLAKLTMLEVFGIKIKHGGLG